MASKPLRYWGVVLVTTLAVLAGCGNGGASSAAPPPVSHAVAVAPAPAKPLTFYEGEEDIEPFTPFAITRTLMGQVLAFGYATMEGANYVATFDATNWQVQSVSNGFLPNDPAWDCDSSPELGTSFAPDGSMVARACVDGSVTVFSLPYALILMHQDGIPATVPVAARIPQAIFSPTSHLLALTNDGPGGPGQKIVILNTTTWQQTGSIAVSAGLLTSPSWSPDEKRLAAVDLNGALHVWDAASGQEVASGEVTPFTLITADKDPSGPAPQWSPDGSTIVTATPTQHGMVLTNPGTLLTAWDAATLHAKATASIAQTPNVVAPQIAPDGSLVLVHIATDHGQIFATPDMKQVGDFALPGTLTQWGSDAHHIQVFTAHATEVTLTIGG